MSIIKKFLLLTIICYAFINYLSFSQIKPLCAYKIDAKWNFIDYKGKLLFAPKSVVDVFGYSEGFFKVKIVENDKIQWAFLNLQGKIISIPHCDEVTLFSEGFALAIVYADTTINKNSKDEYFFIDTTGSKVFIETFIDATPFKQGMAYVNRDGLRGFIDKKGELIIALENGVGYNFSEGLAAISNNKYQVAYINLKGELVTDFKFDEPSEFSEGLASMPSEGSFGYINKKGEFVIKPIYDDARQFHCGRAFVSAFDEKFRSIWGLIDKSGNMILDFQFTRINDFSEGLASVYKNDKWGFIDTTGAYVISPKYDFAGSFKDGIALVYNKSEKKLGFINKADEFVLLIEKAEKIIEFRFNQRL